MPFFEVINKPLSIRKRAEYPGMKTHDKLPEGKVVECCNKKIFKYHGKDIAFWWLSPRSGLTGWLLDWSPGLKKPVLKALEVRWERNTKVEARIGNKWQKGTIREIRPSAMRSQFEVVAGGQVYNLTEENIRDLSVVSSSRPRSETLDSLSLSQIADQVSVRPDTTKETSTMCSPDFPTHGTEKDPMPRRNKDSKLTEGRAPPTNATGKQTGPSHDPSENCSPLPSMAEIAEELQGAIKREPEAQLQGAIKREPEAESSCIEPKLALHKEGSAVGGGTLKQKKEIHLSIRAKTFDESVTANQQQHQEARKNEPNSENQLQTIKKEPNAESSCIEPKRVIHLNIKLKEANFKEEKLPTNTQLQATNIQVEQDQAEVAGERKITDPKVFASKYSTLEDLMEALEGQEDEIIDACMESFLE